MTFAEVERLIGAPLPTSAYWYQAWWANNHTSHVQARAWMAAGWRVLVDIGDQTVRFTLA